MNSFLKKIDRPEIQAIAILSGTIIGVGVFGLPYIFQKTGLIPSFLIFTAVAILIYIVHYIYALIALEGGKHRLVAYVEFFLNRNFKFIPIITSIIGIYGTLIAYVLLGGEFLANIVNSDNILFYQLLYAAIGTILIFIGLRVISWIELIFIIFIFLALAIVFFLKYDFFQGNNFNFIHFNWRSLFLVYGIAMFAMTGASSVPEAVEILVRQRQINKLKKSIFYGTFIPYLFYLLFIIFVLSLSPNGPSLDAISGLNGGLSKHLVFLGSLFGFFTTFSSFLTIGSYMYKLLSYDLKINKIIAVISLFFIPLLALLSGLLSDYLPIIGFIGGILISLELILIILIYYKNQPLLMEKYKFNLPQSMIRLLLIMFSLIIVYEIYSFAAGKL